MKRILALSLFLLLAFAGYAQESRGTISGAVADPSGAAVAAARLVATEVRTGTKVQTVSDVTGHYNLPFLATGEYDLSVSVAGFKEFLRKGIQVGAGDHAVIDVRLEVGQTSTAVEVRAAVSMLNTENASAGQAISTKEVEDIPLNGGTPAMLQQLAIGVIATGTPTLVHPFDLSAPAAFSIGGTRPQTSELLVDGVPDATWDGRAAYNPPRDAVQEVRVKAFDADASFGHTGGGTVNQILKSGTNAFHGSLWEYNQPSNMVANDFFRNRSGQPQQITHFNQFGGTAGGPLMLPHYDGRNKVFWFFAYEGLKDSQPAPALLGDADEEQLFRGPGRRRAPRARWRRAIRGESDSAARFARRAGRADVRQPGKQRHLQQHVAPGEPARGLRVEPGGPQGYGGARRIRDVRGPGDDREPERDRSVFVKPDPGAGRL
jgi:hypothetical protein